MTAQMFPFVFSYDATAAVADMSHLLVAPAGRNGRIRVVGDHFADDAGPVRLNGMNLTGPANFPSHDEAVRLAARLARFGVNCVRLHYMDADYGNFMMPNERGLLAEDHATQRRLDPERLDRMDFLVAEFKRRGIYVNMNLHVARELDARDGVAPGTDWANRGVNQFDTRIIELEREYARDLLARINPYTGMSYLDDPVVALVELNNEDALWSVYRRGCLDAIAEPYASELRGLWNAWLVRTHGADCAVGGKSAAAGDVPIVGTKDDVPDDPLPLRHRARLLDRHARLPPRRTRPPCPGRRHPARLLPPALDGRTRLRGPPRLLVPPGHVGGGRGGELELGDRQQGHG